MEENTEERVIMFPNKKFIDKHKDHSFRYSNFICVYGSVVIPKELREASLEEKYQACRGTIMMNYIDYCCFHYLFCGTSSRWPYLVEIKLWKSPQGRNLTWMTKEQLTEHLNSLKSVLGFDVEFLILEEKNTDYIMVVFETSKLTRLQFKFTCCWIRYAYQFPESAILIDAYRLKELPEYRNENIFNLFLVPARYLVSGVSWGEVMMIRPDQKISTTGRFVSTEVLREKLSNGKSTRLSSIFPTLHKSINEPRYEEIADQVGKFIPWLDDNKFFDIRLPKYREIYQLLKDNEVSKHEKEVEGIIADTVGD